MQSRIGDLLVNDCYPGHVDCVWARLDLQTKKEQVLVCMPLWQTEMQCRCSLGLVCQREVNGDNVTFLDEVIKLSKAAAQLLLL